MHVFRFKLLFARAAIAVESFNKFINHPGQTKLSHIRRSATPTVQEEEYKNSSTRKVAIDPSTNTSWRHALHCHTPGGNGSFLYTLKNLFFLQQRIMFQ